MANPRHKPEYVYPLDRSTAQLDLLRLWQHVQVVSRCMQTLDEPIVRHSDWATYFALADEVLASAADLANEIAGSEYPAEDWFLVVTRTETRSAFMCALRASRNLDFAVAHGYTFAAGLRVAQAAVVLNVDLP